jgi:hypothetical protein
MEISYVSSILNRNKLSIQLTTLACSTGSALPFPIPWYWIPLNVFFCLYTGAKLAINKRMAESAKYVQDKIGTKAMTVMDCFNPPTKGVQVLVSNRPEIELPLDMNPQLHTMRVIPCGPILLSSPSLEQSDPAMAAWVARGPTVLICLGSMTTFTEFAAMEMAMALRMLFTKVRSAWGAERQLQVLWKLAKPKTELYSTEEDSALYITLRREIEADQVRIVDWLHAEPQSILQSGHIVLNVNHGGSSSFHEALW